MIPRSLAALAAVAVFGLAVVPAAAQTATPTTKILAIDTVTPGADLQKVRAILPAEVKATVDLYLQGKIDQWYSREARNGVVFVLNMTDSEAARAMLERLPLGQAHLMSFELIPTGPLNPLRRLRDSGSPG
jgi:hypothetical protein